MDTVEQRPRVLVVDDEESVLRVFERSFRSRYRITAVTSGTKALQLMRAQTFDLVVVDYQMPEMKGTELVRRIEAEHPEVPRIMVTAYGALREVVALQEAHLLSAVLMKPWEFEDVLHAIELALSRASHRQLVEP